VQDFLDPEAKSAGGVMAPARGQFLLILHSHLPLVLGHGRWPHGSDWLSEVTIGCYLPLIEMLDGLGGEGRRALATINMSPVLCEQLAHPSFQPEIEGFLRQRLESVRENRVHFERSGEADLADLTRFWERTYRHGLAQLEALGGDVLGAFRRLTEGGVIELITSAATHGYLPLLGREESIDLQVRVGAATHVRHFGARPRGIWLPECGYRPRYEWTPPAGPLKGKVRRRRRGIEEFLAAHRLESFITDAHLLRGGEPLSSYRDYFPALRSVGGGAEHPAYRRDRTPYRPYVVASRGGVGEAVAFTRDPRTTMQVWSREVGYPGDGCYLEFHKKHFPGGVRYWRVTDPKSDLGEKIIYNPRRAADTVAGHAEHFTRLVGSVLDAETERAGGPVVTCNPYDTELFGHWWFEGPQFLGEVLRRLPGDGIEAGTLSAYLDQHPPTEAVTLLEGSWGEGGDHRVWLNRDTEWSWEMLYAAEEEFWTLAAGIKWEEDVLLRRLMAQLARELLLLQSSDWQFLITTWSARNYAETRFAEHYAHFTRLGQMLRLVAEDQPLRDEDERFLAAREALDWVFPDVVEHVRSAREVRSL
jgi:1,4-alpha-glucan branching enzyme